MDFAFKQIDKELLHKEFDHENKVKIDETKAGQN